MANPTRILVISIDLSVGEFLQQALADEGFNVTVAPNSLIGRELLFSFKPQIVIADMWSLRYGEEFLQAFHEMPHRTERFILLSTSPQDEAHISQLGADTFLAMPFDLDDLLSSINNYLQ